MPHNGPYDDDEIIGKFGAIILEYVDHQSWRCGHPDRYPQDEDCPCGLLGDLKRAGIDPDGWRTAALGSKTDPNPAP